MARRKAIFTPNNTYYITFTILGWNKIFINDEYCQAVYKWFEYCREQYGNEIHGYVIMPDHLHVLMYITDRAPRLPILIMNAKRFMAYELVTLLERDNRHDILDQFRISARTWFHARHKVFTDGYDSLIIESRKFFLQKVNYIHDNPVRSGLAKELEDYRYSSAANYILGQGYYDHVKVIDT
jgi:putative transposase